MFHRRQSWDVVVIPYDSFSTVGGGDRVGNTQTLFQYYSSIIISIAILQGMILLDLRHLAAL